MMLAQKGVTLIELLVSVLILTFVILGASMLFTQAQRYHLGADKRSDIQDHARVIIETMERDMRMIGFGVPTGSDLGGGSSTWKAIFSASSTSIGFSADIDNGHTILTADATATDIPVEDITYYSAVASTPIDIILVNNRKQWAGVTVNGRTGNTLTASAIPSFGTFTSKKSEIFSMERVFYQMTGGGGDGICDSGYPFCSIQRQELLTKDASAATEAFPLTMETLGENVYSLNLAYETASGGPVNPSNASELPSIGKIIITLVCRNRWFKQGDNPWDYQDITLTSHVLIRNRAL